MQTQSYFANRNLQLQDEQKWLEQINNAKVTEDRFLKQQRNERVKDLRATYAQQLQEKGERTKCFMKY